MPLAATARSRRTGLCPTFVEPSVQRDGMLFRVPLVGGLLTLDQARRIADMAERHGNGIIEMTNRGNVQLRGIAAGSVTTVVAALSAAGFGEEMARVVTISPLAGPREQRVRAALVDALSEVDRRGLTGKFFVHVDDGSMLCGQHADAIVLCNDDDSVTVAAGGVVQAMALDAAVETCRRIVATCIADGPNTRWKDIVVAGAAATHGPGLVLLLPGLVSTENGLAVVAEFVLGRTDPRQLRALVSVAETNVVDEIRVTPWRSVVFAVADATAALRVLGELGDIGLITSAVDPAHGVVACIGRTGCWQTELDTLAAAADIIARRAEGEMLGTAHISGCAKSCATQQMTAVTLRGRDDSSGFDVIHAGCLPS